METHEWYTMSWWNSPCLEFPLLFVVILLLLFFFNITLLSYWGIRFAKPHALGRSVSAIGFARGCTSALWIDSAILWLPLMHLIKSLSLCICEHQTIILGIWTWHLLFLLQCHFLHETLGRWLIFIPTCLLTEWTEAAHSRSLGLLTSHTLLANGVYIPWFVNHRVLFSTHYGLVIIIWACSTAVLSWSD